MTTALALAFMLMGPVSQQGTITSGQLIVPSNREGVAPGVCPLENTKVTADIAGIAARVTIVQTFVNPYKDPIEAVYTFPMRSGAAVDRMRIQIGSRVIEGEIKRAEEARRIYDAAKAAGQTAALLDQERPNIFTQSVANIMPGEKIQVEISYVEVLNYEEGEFEFVFPMVVGPRNTMNASDPGKIFPSITPKGTRTGTDVQLTVSIDSGDDFETVSSQLHAIEVLRRGKGKYQVSLSRKDEIPNRDFILKWRPLGEGLQDSFITHASGGKGTFCLTILPPQRVPQNYIAPREVIFVMDESGSQQGFPIEKSKELTLAMIDELRPNDVFNVLTFRTGINFLWPESMPSSKERVREAREFVKGLQGSGGTNFLPPLNATVSKPPTDGRLKLVVFNSDGYVGDDFEILDLVQRFSHNARLFTFGIGNSINRFLIDGMSAEGRGASEIITLASDVKPAIERFIKRTQSPVLTDVRVDIIGGNVHDVTPSALPDMFSHAPLVIFGRYEKAGLAKVTVSGRVGGKPWKRTIDVVLPAEGDSGEGITKVWARKRLDDMVRKDWMMAARSARNNGDYTSTPDQLVNFALEHEIMSQWTSFVAVEKRVVNVGGKQRTVRVPVEMADGVSYEGIDGLYMGMQTYGQTNRRSYRGGGSFGGGGGGGGGGAANLSRTRQSTATKAGRVTGGAAFDSEVQGGSAAGIGTPESKIHKSLKDKKEGTVEIQVMLTDWPEDWEKLLKEAGLKVEDSDKGLKVVFGTIDAKKLLALAKLGFVTKIRPLEQ